ncbi:MAG: hypothetical protein H0X42_02120 [Solirubrobacterales bacterium]|nr:hypothetical protein [Solirubrobacterales bacterium]
MARGTKLSAGILASALFALLAFAPFASAASDPVASGTTTVTLNKSFTKYLGTFGIKVSKVSPAKVKGSKATFTVTGGTIDPTTGLGEVTLGGGLKIKAGKKSTTIKALVLDTSKKALTGKIAGKKTKVATIAGWSFARNGFGVNLTIKKLKLNGSAATALNKKLGFAKGTPKPFIGGKLIGTGASETQPSTVTVKPGGLMTLAADATTFKKLSDVKVKIPVSAPTTEPSLGTFAFPIIGGTVGPTGTAGVVQSAGGLQLLQKLPTSATTFIETEINLGNVYADLAAKTLTVEVVAKSTASPSLNLGNLGRSSIADITVPGVVADPATRTVTVTNAPATLQVVSAEVLEGFVKVYQGYVEGGNTKAYCENPVASPGGCATAPELETAKAFGKVEGEKAVKDDHIAAGNPLGTVSFTAQGE